MKKFARNIAIVASIGAASHLISAIAQTALPQGLDLTAMLNQSGKAGFEKYRADNGEHKAFVICASGAWAYVTKEESAQKAMDAASLRAKRNTSDPYTPCKVHAVDAALRDSGPRLFDTVEAAKSILAQVELKKTAYVEEDKPSTVTPTSSLNRNFHSATPSSIPGGKVIATPDLKVLLASTEPPVLINVLPAMRTSLPGSLGNNDIGADITSGGDVAAQKFLERNMADKSKPVVFYCLSWECWLSYNAAVRAIALGYTNVHWYRGGLYSWFDAELPLVVNK